MIIINLINKRFELVFLKMFYVYVDYLCICKKGFYFIFKVVVIIFEIFCLIN